MHMPGKRNVVVAPHRVDVGALDGEPRLVEEQLEPTRVVHRRAEVEAFVAREAERAGRLQQPRDIQRREHESDEVVFAPDLLGELQERGQLHRVDASKQ
jgi:hypothetical protein